MDGRNFGEPFTFAPGLIGVAVIIWTLLSSLDSILSSTLDLPVPNHHKRQLLLWTKEIVNQGLILIAARFSVAVLEE